MTDKDYGISGVRLIAFILIVLCHFFQYYAIELAWWFNVGVQIFLFVSGLLYGKKYVGKSIDGSGFIKGRLIKILVPYYLVVMAVTAIHVLGVHDLSKKDILKALILNKNIPGGEHLWFVSTILMCYFLTILYSFVTKESNKRFVVAVVLTVCGLFIFFTYFVKFYNAVWIICYFFGFVYGTVEKRYPKSLLKINIVVIVLASQNIIQIYLSYFNRMIDTENEVYKIWCDFNHIWLGITLFWVLRYLFSRINYSKHGLLEKVLYISDNYSYEAYLVHQFYILGPLSLMGLTPFIPINIIIVIALILLSAFLLKQAEKLIFRFISIEL